LSYVWGGRGILTIFQNFSQSDPQNLAKFSVENCEP